MALDPVTAVTDLASTVINKIWPDKSEAEKQQLAAAVALVQGQLDVNKEEAKNPNTFVSGGRPFVIWICGLSLGYSALFEPLLRFVATVIYHYTGTFPTLDTTLTGQILFGLLGLGAMRSFDKKNGVASM